MRAADAPYSVGIVTTRNDRPSIPELVTASVNHAVPLSLGDSNNINLDYDAVSGREVSVYRPTGFELEGELAHGWRESSAVFARMTIDDEGVTRNE